jgi:hypothetical protein
LKKENPRTRLVLTTSIAGMWLCSTQTY